MIYVLIIRELPALKNTREILTVHVFAKKRCQWHTGGWLEDNILNMFLTRTSTLGRNSAGLTDIFSDMDQSWNKMCTGTP